MGCSYSAGGRGKIEVSYTSQIIHFYIIVYKRRFYVAFGGNGVLEDDFAVRNVFWEMGIC